MPISIRAGDLTRFTGDAIVNAANSSLLGGGGVDGAIHRAAGPDLLAECRDMGGCPTGEARITKAYNLSCHYVIHTVGPVWKGGDAQEPELLAACHRNSLALARAHGIVTLAFPAISCGVYGYPIAEAANIAVSTVHADCVEHGELEVHFICFGEETLTAFQTAAAAL